MNNKVLSIEQCEQLERSLNYIGINATKFYEQVTESIAVFNNNPTVQSFYASGKLGKEMEQELLKIRDAVQKYYQALSENNGLIPVTKLVVEEQRELLNSSYKGGN